MIIPDVYHTFVNTSVNAVVNMFINTSVNMFVISFRENILVVRNKKYRMSESER